MDIVRAAVRFGQQTHGVKHTRTTPAEVSEPIAATDEGKVTIRVVRTDGDADERLGILVGMSPKATKVHRDGGRESALRCECARVCPQAQDCQGCYTITSSDAYAAKPDVRLRDKAPMQVYSHYLEVIPTPPTTE